MKKRHTESSSSHIPDDGRKDTEDDDDESNERFAVPATGTLERIVAGMKDAQRAEPHLTSQLRTRSTVDMVDFHVEEERMSAGAHVTADCTKKRGV